MLRIPRLASLVLVVLAALVATGCGGSGKDIGDVRSCLEKLDLNVESPDEKDKDVEDGVFATTDLTEAKEDEFTFAMAAVVKDEKAIKRFQDESEEFSKSASEDDKLEFKTGTDGTYVWVVGGSTKGDAYEDARGCVEP